MSEYTGWFLGFICPDCEAEVDGGGAVGTPCYECGSFHQSLAVAYRYKLKRIWFLTWNGSREVKFAPKELEYKYSSKGGFYSCHTVPNTQPSPLAFELAKRLEIEADGGDSPAAFVQAHLDDINNYIKSGTIQ